MHFTFVGCNSFLEFFWSNCFNIWNSYRTLQEQPPFDKKQFVAFIKKYIKLLTPKLDAEAQEVFKKNIEGATKFLLSKLSDLQL